MQPREFVNTKKIEAIGNSVVRAEPDAAVLRLGVTTQAELPAEAVQQNADRMVKVIAAVKKQKIPESAIQTAELQLESVTKWDEDSQTEILVGYRATNVITVTTPIGKAVAVYDTSVAAGVNTASGLRYVVDDDKKYRREGLAQATKMAIDEIHTVAKALGTKLDGPLMAEVMEVVPPPLIEYHFAAADEIGAATPIIPGRVEITSRVRVIYEIKAT
ncbi:SIMPL domain-containing protein [Nannocystis sp. ILAH1]|uniref:SIMPL domain-containing protein n=1 Tax=unclassified Nannocystis TaxID=2627009 RepID=UPI00226F09B0|nr:MULTISPECIES: SIMPL domain-containing protein [unclassified Nannocystis]MCY0987781.1 SIMPL domain-containing protein [Nannocystis sp. ILAH1]MCY1070418.1 SIMPL domain-containing protein [Nannocystis sp. RBIL2]